SADHHRDNHNALTQLAKIFQSSSDRLTAESARIILDDKPIIIPKELDWVIPQDAHRESEYTIQSSSSDYSSVVLKANQLQGHPTQSESLHILLNNQQEGLVNNQQEGLHILFDNHQRTDREDKDPARGSLEDKTVPYFNGCKTFVSNVTLLKTVLLRVPDFHMFDDKQSLSKLDSDFGVQNEGKQTTLVFSRVESSPQE
ncbi:hypothetical protein M427DRAFT_50338, partial [Gonapodya prolifera JEL478]